VLKIIIIIILIIIIIIINIFVKHHKVVNSEALAAVGCVSYHEVGLSKRLDE